MISQVYQVSSGRTSNNLYIGNFQKRGCVGPDAFACLTWVPKSGFRLTMWSYDMSPIAKCTDINGPLHEDSCLSCFLDVFPRYRYKGYISITANSEGICQCSFGPNEIDRKSFAQMGLPELDVEILHPLRDGGRCWMLRTLIPIETVRSIYDLPCRLHPGHKMRANFCTSCENGQFSYWGTWAPSKRDSLHSPEYFGCLEII